MLAASAIAVAAASWAASGATAAASPFPAVLVMSSGLTMSNTVKAPPWGTVLSARQSRWISIKSRSGTIRWGVWHEDQGPAIFPVRTTDAGARWEVVGPLLATDWAGGSLYYVTAALAEGASSVVMVSPSIIDVTTDAGHRWFQYLNVASDWAIVSYPMSGGRTAIRVSGAANATFAKTWYAVYVLDVARHRWRRVVESLS